MKKLLLTAALACIAGAAQAQTIDDPLHTCPVGGPCTSFNSVTLNSPLGSPLAPFGVTSSPSALTGTLYFALLIPGNASEITLPTLTADLGGHTLSVGTFIDEGFFANSGNLDTLFSPNSTPSNPISSYTAATAAVDSGFNAMTGGYEVFLVKLTGTGTQASPPLTGLVTTPGAGGQVPPPAGDSFSLGGGVYVEPSIGGGDFAGVVDGAIGTFFLDTSGVIGEDGKTVGTANSSSMLFDATPTAVVPEPSTWIMALGGFGLIGLLGLRKRRVTRFAV